MIHVDHIGEITRLKMGRSVLGRGWYYTAAFLVDGLLVDTGCAHTVGDLLEALERHGGVSTIVNTHSHEDHIAGNAALKRKFGATVLAHPLALPVLADPSLLDPVQLYRRIFWGLPEASRGQALGPWVETGRHRFQVIHTPGHSEDHVCLFEPQQGWLMTGDAFVGGQDRGLRPHIDIWQILASLELLASLEPGVMFAGSGSVYPRATEALRQKIAYLRRMGEQVRELHGQGWSSSRIRRAVLERESIMAYLTLGDFTGAHLVRSFLEHNPRTNPLEQRGTEVGVHG